ncbi:MAG: benzoyl-CoA reductase subunit C [Deltaproteobacteria bacterium]|nr:benzoyl-CoA reductase subunit C [Deltaproteobacteria bacterium]
MTNEAESGGAAPSAVDEVVARAEALYHDVELSSVQRWRDAHGGAKAVGYMPIYVPRELIHAAGMLPVGLMGGRGQVEIIRGDAWFQSYICQIPRSTIELALTGRYALLDGFLFPSICDVIRNLSGMWKVLFPEKYVRYLDVPQNYDPDVGGRFFGSELRSLYADLCALSGEAPSDERLRASIALYNDNRRSIGRLMELRATEPWSVPAWEVYLALYAGNLLPVEEHTALVDAYIAAARAASRPRRDNARVVLSGAFCEQPPLELIRTLELAGCYVVADDMALGRRWPEGDIEVTGDPIAAIAEAFITRSPATAARYEAHGDRGAPLVQLVRKSHAEGVVLAAPSFCDPALLEQPILQDSLDKERLPWTAFKYSENLGQFQVIREQAGTFADSIKLWSEA